MYSMSLFNIGKFTTLLGRTPLKKSYLLYIKSFYSKMIKNNKIKIDLKREMNLDEI